jgi:alcohol dehydrogenase (cytochrome c)/quinohemoprotein ethanol dehydrogenase
MMFHHPESTMETCDMKLPRIPATLAILSMLLMILLAGACADESGPEAPTRAPAAVRDNQPAPAVTARSGLVDGARIMHADREPGNWMTHGRTYDEQRFSPLDQINTDNAARLGLAWYYDLDSKRGQEATPIVVDGVMYVTSAWSKVKALDAVSGKLIWAYDPKVPGEWAINACCDVVNRGVALWNDKVYVGTLDGRLVALAAASGTPVWEVQTFDKNQPYSITGAPRIVKGKVLIGNGGAEFGVRGYITAYDADSGDQMWRFYTVPGNPADGFESPVLAQAARTWTGEWWKQGGGGTVWDSMAYDPDLDLLYIGVGNGSPWDRDIRSPGGGDNLFLSSIVALRPDSGEYVWHYQTTPGDNWDYTATQHIILADLEIGGVLRKVLMQLPKNGFFYVLDRATGELLSAAPVIPVNWATGIDMQTGRPIENPEARYRSAGKTWVAMPGPLGAHNWQPMSFSPLTGLVYIPVNVAGYQYGADQNYAPHPQAFNTGTDFVVAAELPQDAAAKQEILDGITGHLAAWDPVQQKEVWRVPYHGPNNGGTLATAGNLVIEGTASGDFAIYRADNGEKLWSMPVQTGVVAAPVSYQAGGEQYIAVLSGWGGIFALAPGEISFVSSTLPNISRVLAFKLNGEVRLPMATETPVVMPSLRGHATDTATVELGYHLYHRFCGNCHGNGAVSGGVLPDLRRSTLLETDAWYGVVAGGALQDKGMVSFAGVLDRGQMEAIHAYITEQGRRLAAKVSDH